MKQRQRPKIIDGEKYKKLSGDASDDSSEDTELFIRKAQFQDIPTVEKVVEEEDTLQALSIKYHCPISELKRLNNIHRENEIFAKRTIKVPVRSFSEALVRVHVSGSSSPHETSSNSKREIDVDKLKVKLSKQFSDSPTGSDVDLSTNTVELNRVIFNSNVKPVKNCDNVNETLINKVDCEEIRLLPIHMASTDSTISNFTCNGADADISWIALIVCIIIIIFAVPLIYVLYIAEHPEQYHHDHS